MRQEYIIHQQYLKSKRVIMQLKEAECLRKMFKNKSCQHLSIDKEYDLGAHTGDYVCEHCGKIFISKEDWEKERESIEKINSSP